MKIGKPLDDATSAQVFGQHHQMVVMHPDEIAVPGDAFDSIRKFCVHRTITGPVRRIELTARRQSVEQGPDDFVRESFVIGGLLGGGQKDRFYAVILLRRPTLPRCSERLLIIPTSPPHPASAILVKNRCERAAETASTPFQ